MLYRRVEIKDGATEEPVSFVGVHPIKWYRMGGDAPDAAFIEAFSDDFDPVLKALAELYEEYINAPYTDENVMQRIPKRVGDSLAVLVRAYNKWLG